MVSYLSVHRSLNHLLGVGLQLFLGTVVMQASIITEEEAQATLSAGLERWEKYVFPEYPQSTAGGYGGITEEIMDKCWDIELYLRQSLKETALAHYVPEKSKHGKRYGRTYINIFSHTRVHRGVEYHYDAIDSVLHELAHHIHFMCFPHDKAVHGQKWKWICKIIGANPMATQESFKKIYAD